MIYATLTEFKQVYRRSLTDTNEDALLSEFLEWASSFVDWYKDRRFDVRQEVLKFDSPVRTVGRIGRFDQFSAASLDVREEKALRLDEDLLEVNEILNGGGTEISTFFLEPGRSYPKSTIRLSRSLIWELDPDGEYRGAIQIDGFWGYVPHYPDAFVDSLDSILNTPNLPSNQTTLQVSDVSGSASDGKSPRFQSGQLLRLSSTGGVEFVKALTPTSVPSGNDTVLVQRGVNGTTAVVHPTGTKLEIFRPFGPIHQSVLRLAQWRYVQKDSNSFDRTYLLGAGVLEVPPGIPPDVLATLGPRGKVRL